MTEMRKFISDQPCAKLQDLSLAWVLNAGKHLNKLQGTRIGHGLNLPPYGLGLRQTRCAA